MSDKEAAVKLPTINWAFNPYNALMIAIAAGGVYATMNSRLDAADERAKKYVPVIEETQRFMVAQLGKDKTQDDRMENVIDSIKDLRRVSNDQLLAQARTNTEVLAQLSAIRETLAWFRATIEASGGKPPPQRP